MPRGRPKGSKNKKPSVIEIEPQRADESDEDFQRRYQREINRRYDEANRGKRAAAARERRAARRALLGPPKLRGPNKAPLKDGIEPRRVEESDEDWKARYRRERMAIWRAEHPERNAENQRRNQATDEYKATAAAWRAANPEKWEAAQARYFERNRERKLSALKQWAKDNPERFREAARRWVAKQPPGFNAANVARYRALAVRGTPPWMWSLYGKEIDRIYSRCARISKTTGIPHHVDHIWPLAGKNFSGLHVPWNLRIVPASINLRKHNKSPEEFDEIP